MARAELDATCLAEGQVMISSGFREAPPSQFGGLVMEPEIYDPAIAACMRVPTSNRFELPAAPPFVQGSHLVNAPQPDYPYMFISQGRILLETGPGCFTGWYDTIHYVWNWRGFFYNGNSQQAGSHDGSAVTFEPGGFMRCGGGTGGQPPNKFPAVLRLGRCGTPGYIRSNRPGRAKRSCGTPADRLP